MLGLEALQARMARVESLRSVVRTMKAMAMANQRNVDQAQHAITATSAIETIAGNVTHKGIQAGYAVGGKVDVIACLPGFLVLAGEIENLQVVDDVRIGFGKEREGVVAADLLVTQAECVCTCASPEVDRGEVIIKLATKLTAIVL